MISTPDTYHPASYRQKDQELYEEWQKTRSKKSLGALLDQLSPVIYSEVQRASGSLPTAALSAEAKKWTVKAIESYDPSKGTTLSTHVMNYLPKIRRLNYKFQNAVRLPENMQLKYHEYSKHLTQLTEQLNREPTDDELAHKLGWSKGQTVKFKNSLYADLIESASERPSEHTQFNERSILMEHILNQLTPDEKFIFESSKGMSSSDAAAHLGVNVNRYNYLKSKLVQKLQKMMHEVGM